MSPIDQITLVDRLWQSATAESAREIADRTWDLVHDRPDDDPVKRRVVECHEERDEGLLTFEADELLRRVEEQGDLFAPVLAVQQQLPALR